MSNMMNSHNSTVLGTQTHPHPSPSTGERAVPAAGDDRDHKRRHRRHRAPPSRRRRDLGLPRGNPAGLHGFHGRSPLRDDGAVGIHIFARWGHGFLAPGHVCVLDDASGRALEPEGGLRLLRPGDSYF